MCAVQVVTVGGCCVAAVGELSSVGGGDLLRLVPGAVAGPLLCLVCLHGLPVVLPSSMRGR